MGSIPAKFNDLVTWATGSAAASATSPISYSSGCASASISSAGSDPSVGQTNKQGWLNSASSEPVATLDGAIAPSMRLKSSFQSDHPSGGETETATETHSETGAETQPESNRNPTGIQPESNRNPTLNQTQDWKNYTQTEIVTIISRWNRQSLFMGSNRIERDRTGLNWNRIQINCFNFPVNFLELIHRFEPKLKPKPIPNRSQTDPKPINN